MQPGIIASDTDLGRDPQYLDGKLEYVEGGTGEETAEFLEPLRTCQVRYVGHPQPLAYHGI